MVASPCPPRVTKTWWQIRRAFADPGSMARHISVVFSGTAAAQVLLALSAPLVAHIYGPSAYGTYSYFFGVALAIAGLATLRFDAAVPLPREDGDAAALIWLASSAALAISVLTAVAIPVLRMWAAPSHALWNPWVWSLPLLVFLVAQFALWGQVALRLQLYSVVARRPLVQNASTVILQGCLAPLGLGPGGLVVGQLAARMTTTGMLARSGKALWRRPDVGGLRAVGARYARFPLVFAPAAFLNSLALYLPVILVTGSFGAAAAGHVGLGQQLVLFPAATLGTAVGQVYLARLADNRRREVGGNRSVFLRASLFLGICAVAFAAAVILVVPWALPMILGDEWAPAGSVAAAMSVSAGCGLVASPLSSILFAAERGISALALDSFRVAAVGGSGYAAVAAGGSLTTVVLCMSLAQAFVYVVTWAVCLGIVSSSSWR